MGGVNNSGRENWIDVAKFVAIMAVMIDHTLGILYENPMIARVSYYSVSLFILMMGITSFWSLSGVEHHLPKKIAQKCWAILRPYVCATFIYVIFRTGSFSFEKFIQRLIFFNAAGPLYYVSLYIQLVIVSPILFLFLNKKRYTHFFEMIGFVVTLVVAALTVNYTDILSIYGGGGKLFGGLYLSLLYLGMWFGKYCNCIKREKRNIALFIVVEIGSLLAIVVWGKFMVLGANDFDLYFPFGEGVNPPSITVSVYAILIGILLYAFGMIIEILDKDWLKKAFSAVSYLGKHTLYIFLYHFLFLNYILNKIFEHYNIVDMNMWIKRALYFSTMILGSLIIEKILLKLRDVVKLAYRWE